jgi:hypothetical protein
MENVGMNPQALIVRATEGLAELKQKVAQFFRITGDDSLAVAAESISIAHKLQRELEIARKAEVEPFNSQVSAINAKYKAVMVPLGNIESDLKTKVDIYKAELLKAAELANRKAEEEKRKAEQEGRERERKRAKAEAKRKEDLEALPELPADMFKAPVVDIPKEAPKSIQTNFGGITSVEQWDFRVVDKSIVPLEFLVVDESAIRRKIKDGVRSIPGVEIFSEMRTRNTRS